MLSWTPIILGLIHMVHFLHVSDTSHPSADSPPPRAPLIALTYDDGPHITRTAEILNILDEEEVHATFFLVGNRINKQTRNIILRELRSGHSIGIHSETHAKLPTLNDELFAQEIILPQIRLWYYTGQRTTLFRFPYGLEDGRLWKYFSGKSIGWNIDSRDWNTPNSNTLIQHVIHDAKPNGIILMHDIKTQTIEATRSIIRALKSEGYTFVTVDELIRYAPEMDGQLWKDKN